MFAGPAIDRWSASGVTMYKCSDELCHCSGGASGGHSIIDEPKFAYCLTRVVIKSWTGLFQRWQNVPDVVLTFKKNIKKRFCMPF